MYVHVQPSKKFATSNWIICTIGWGYYTFLECNIWYEYGTNYNYAPWLMISLTYVHMKYYTMNSNLHNKYVPLESWEDELFHNFS